MQLKFRAFCEKQKIMHYDFQFIKSGNMHGNWIIFLSDKQLPNSNWRDNPYSCQQFEMMQFTGLIDKNGKEAYHKDIVRMSIFLYTVEWCNKSAKFYLKSINNIDGVKYAMTKLPKYGIIEGNIFENPELIGETE
jgi:uncharacterized phage protein (TIGR01671 family)